MRRSKIITIEGRGEVTVKELTALGIYTAWNAEGRWTTLQGLLDEAVQPGFDVIKTWYPSEQEQILSALLDVNSAFFGMARTLRVDGLIREILGEIADSLPAAFADLFRRGISLPGIMDGDVS